MLNHPEILKHFTFLNMIISFIKICMKIICDIISVGGNSGSCAAFLHSIVIFVISNKTKYYLTYVHFNDKHCMNYVLPLFYPISSLGPGLGRSLLATFNLCSLEQTNNVQIMACNVPSF